jgi:hypothetical protein
VPSVSGIKKDLPVVFSAQNIRDIADALPKPVCERRCKLLPQILQEWARNDLQRVRSLATPQDILQRNQRIKRVEKCAQGLLDALSATDNHDRNFIVHRIISKERSPDQIDRSELDEFPNLKKRLEEESCFLARLAAIAPTELEKSEDRRPRNYAAYLVLMDAASIFLWFTGRNPPRSHAETSPFRRFASVLWPLVLKKGNYGLSNGMKNWADDRSGLHHSPLIANIDLRHPTWRIREC